MTKIDIIYFEKKTENVFKKLLTIKITKGALTTNYWPNTVLYLSWYGSPVVREVLWTQT